MITVTGATSTALAGDSEIVWWLDVFFSSTRGYTFRDKYAPTFLDDFTYLTEVGGTYTNVLGDKAAETDIHLISTPSFGVTSERETREDQFKIATATGWLNLETDRLSDGFRGTEATFGVYVMDSAEKITLGKGIVVPVGMNDFEMTLTVTGTLNNIKSEIPFQELTPARWDRVDDSKDNPDPANELLQLNTLGGVAYKGRSRKAGAPAVYYERPDFIWFEFDRIENLITVGSGD